MFKKIFGIAMATAFIFGTATLLNISATLSGTRSRVCYNHDGDVWRN